jgi:hypothetical protein
MRFSLDQRADANDRVWPAARAFEDRFRREGQL